MGFAADLRALLDEHAGVIKVATDRVEWIESRIPFVREIGDLYALANRTWFMAVAFGLCRHYEPNIAFERLLVLTREQLDELDHYLSRLPYTLRDFHAVMAEVEAEERAAQAAADSSPEPATGS